MAMEIQPQISFWESHQHRYKGQVLFPQSSGTNKTMADPKQSNTEEGKGVQDFWLLSVVTIFFCNVYVSFHTPFVCQEHLLFQPQKGRKNRTCGSVSNSFAWIVGRKLLFEEHCSWEVISIAKKTNSSLQIPKNRSLKQPKREPNNMEQQKIAAWITNGQ